jgi:HTH-type transcriptional regulator / antitoxin HipB
LKINWYGNKMTLQGQKMSNYFQVIATHIKTERKRQNLTREQMAGICGVSSSFIRDAESDPAKCTLGRLLRVTEALGMQLAFTGSQIPPAP